MDAIFILISNTFLNFLAVNGIYQLFGTETEQDMILGMLGYSLINSLSTFNITSAFSLLDKLFNEKKKPLRTYSWRYWV